MSDLMSAICDDIREYRRLCELYDEDVQYQDDYYGIPVENCYGEHATKLKEKHNENQRNRRN